MTDSDGKTSAEAQIRAPLDEQARAIRATDIDGTVANYAPDVLLFDVVRPPQHPGSDALRKRLTEWFASFRGPIGYELRDLSIATAGDVAFCHSVNRVNATTGDGRKLDMWWRATVRYRKLEGEWMITHEHVSLPFDVESGRALLDLKP